MGAFPFMKCTHKSYSNKHKPYPHLFLCLFSSLTITSSLLASTRPPHAPATRASIPHRQINNARNAGVHPPRQINNARNAGVHPPSHVISARNAGVNSPIACHKRPQRGRPFPSPNQQRPQHGRPFPSPNQQRPQRGRQFPLAIYGEGGRKTGGEVKPPKEIGECPVEKKRNFSRLTCASQL